MMLACRYRDAMRVVDADMSNGQCALLVTASSSGWRINKMAANPFDEISPDLQAFQRQTPVFSRVDVWLGELPPLRTYRRRRECLTRRPIEGSVAVYISVDVPMFQIGAGRQGDACETNR